MSGDLHSRRDMDRMLQEGVPDPVAAAQELAGFLNALLGRGLVVTAEGFDVMAVGHPRIGVVFEADGIWHSTENG